MPQEVEHRASIDNWLTSIPPSITVPSPPLLTPLECPSPDNQRKRKRYEQPSSCQKRQCFTPSSRCARSHHALNTSLATDNTVSVMPSETSPPSSTSAATSLSHRTILKPVPPSRKQSQSPTRKHHRLLAHALQPINIRQPRDTEQLESVAAFRSALSKRHGF
jgi:hypothetical protein